MRYIALAAQFDGDRETALGDGEVFAKALLQLPPKQRKALVEGLPTRVSGQQVGLGPEIA
ncbi:hypothetical protein D3C80_2012430 [compost metagenome]